MRPRTPEYATHTQRDTKVPDQASETSTTLALQQRLRGTAMASSAMAPSGWRKKARGCQLLGTGCEQCFRIKGRRSLKVHEGLTTRYDTGRMDGTNALETHLGGPKSRLTRLDRVGWGESLCKSWLQTLCCNGPPRATKQIPKQLVDYTHWRCQLCSFLRRSCKHKWPSQQATSEGSFATMPMGDAASTGCQVG